MTCKEERPLIGQLGHLCFLKHHFERHQSLMAHSYVTPPVLLSQWLLLLNLCDTVLLLRWLMRLSVTLLPHSYSDSHFRGRYESRMWSIVSILHQNCAIAPYVHNKPPKEEAIEVSHIKLMYSISCGKGLHLLIIRQYIFKQACCLSKSVSMLKMSLTILELSIFNGISCQELQ